MKARILSHLHWSAAILLLLTGLTQAAAAANEPIITSVGLENSNVVVTVECPPGVCKLSLECRERLGPGAWEPRAVIRSTGLGEVVVFRLPASRQLELLRVRGDANEPLPSSFYTGPSDFPAVAEVSAPSVYGRGDVVYFNINTAVPTGMTPVPTTPTREVAESDIWKFRRQKLYFFNQRRGLQVIDVADPDRAVLQGTYVKPAAGEQMYLLGASHIVLLARTDCSSYRSESELVILADRGADPVAVASLPVAGAIQESRLVGTALYVASQTFREMPGRADGVWEWGTHVTSFDLSNPDSPVAGNDLWYPGYGNVVTATDRLLFVTTQNPNKWWRSIIHVVDITSPDGTMQDYTTIEPAGLVKDKFKLNYASSILTSISEDRFVGGNGGLVTRLETFSLPDPSSLTSSGPRRLGQLEVGRNETLRATRFDGNRVYIVTFFQIDPLFVVSIADPTEPRLLGEVEIPGWSTYMEPMGDRLVTVGVETNRVAVSLFDVANGAHPSLLSRVNLGENHSYSEANFDEKAFTVLPEAGLILLPATSYDGNGYVSAVQLIDLNRNTLVKRGVIDRSLEPRRATLYGNRILSISGTEFLSVDAADRDHPEVRGELELAWSVDKVFVRANYLVELSVDQGPEPGARLRVARVAAPDAILNDVLLTNLPVWGASVKGDRLYILQGTDSWRFYEVPVRTLGTSVPTAPTARLLLSIFDLSSLPEVRLVGQTTAPSDSWGWNGSFAQAVWPSANLLVWVRSHSSYWNYYSPGPIFSSAVGVAFRLWGGEGVSLSAFDVADPANPVFASELKLNSQENGWGSLGKAFAAAGLIYLSHHVYDYSWGYPMIALPPVPLAPQPPPATPPPTPATVTALGGSGGAIAAPTGIFPGPWFLSPLQRSFLDVVDYADPVHPTVRKPVSLPGALQGISQGGAVLYASGSRASTNWLEQVVEVSALAYDGVAAHLIDSFPITNGYNPAVLVAGTNLFITHAEFESSLTKQAHLPTPTLETWTLSASGKLTRLGSFSLASPPSALAEFPGMLAVQAQDQSVCLLDSTDASGLRKIGSGAPAECVGFLLENCDGSAPAGLWIPLGGYGLAHVPSGPARLKAGFWK